MFSRKKRELMKTPSISKKSRAGSPIPQTLPVSVPHPPRQGGSHGATGTTWATAPTELPGRATGWEGGPEYGQGVCEEEEEEGAEEGHCSLCLGGGGFCPR